MKELIIRGVTSLDHAYELTRNYELVIKSLFVQHFECCRAYSNPHSSNSKGLAVPPNSSIVSTNGKGKGVASDPLTLNSRVKCFNCQGFGHVAAKCPTRPLVMFEKKKEGDEDDLEEVYEPDLTLDDIDDIECEGDTRFGCIQMIPPCNKSLESSLERQRVRTPFPMSPNLHMIVPSLEAKVHLGSSLGSL